MNLTQTVNYNLKTRKTINSMKNKFTISLCLIIFLSFAFIACDKKKEEKKKTVKYDVKEKYVIPKSYTISGFHLKDTVNNIFGAVLMPVSRVKENPVNIKPINKSIGMQMQEFVDQVKSKGKTQGKNYIEIRPSFFVFHGDIYSCLIKKTICFANSDTVKSYNTIIYNDNTKNTLGFEDIFSVDKSNLSGFLALFNKDMAITSIEELKKIDFNIEVDSISFNVKQTKPTNCFIQKQFKQSIETLRPYLKDKEIFIKD